MTPFAALLGGGTGGLGGAAAAHLVVSLADRWAGAGDWLRGPYGPPFFNISLFLGIMYGGIALGLTRKLSPTLLGFLGPFLGIALPLAVLTRTAKWGAGPEAAPTAAWLHAVLAVYVVAVWGTVFALGARLAERRSWLGGLACIAGALAAYGVLWGLLKAAPGIGSWPWAVGSLLPQPTVLLDGLLTGAGIGIALSLASGRAYEKTDRA